MSYEAIALLPSACAVDLASIEPLLQEKLPHMTANRTKKTLVLSDGWTIQLQLEEDPWVAIESADIVERYGAARPDAVRLKSAPRRLIVKTDPDANMDRFNDYVFVLEVLLSFEGVAVFDPKTREFI